MSLMSWVLQRIFIIGQYFGNNQSYLEAVNYGRGLAYSPFQSCVVVTHENISCLTVPGVGADLFWQVRVGVLVYKSHMAPQRTPSTCIVSHRTTA